ncbi:hypothetical protein ACTFIZ_008390 [Dictyostelium cf. discoideum]
MKNKYIILYLFLLISQIYCVDPPSCKTTKNVYKDSQVFIDGNVVSEVKNVKWWVLEQLGHSRGAIYTDSELAVNSEINEIAIFNIRNQIEINPITETYKQSYEKNSGNTMFNSLSYNDDPSGDNSAHAKGFFIWNEKGGVHVIHSVPKTPEKGYFPLFNYASGTLNNQHAQHSICITLSKEELYIIPKYIIYSNLNIQTINTVSISSNTKKVSLACSYSEGLKNIVDKKTKGVIELDKIQNLTKNPPKTFKELDNLMKKNIFAKKNNDNEPDEWDGIIYLNKWSQLAYLILNEAITSSDLPRETNVHYNKIYEGVQRRYFIQTTNSEVYKWYAEKNLPTYKETIKFFIVWHYIESSKIGNNIKTMVHTQTKIGKSKNAITQEVDSVYVSYRFETPWSSVTFSDSGSDHSKMSYQFNNIDKVGSGGGGGTFCFGDLNWQGKQESRGGGAFCSDEMKYLSEYFYRRVGIIRHPVGGQYSIKNSLRLNSIAGQRLNLNELLKKYPTELTTLLNKRKLDFEIKVKGYGDDEKYYHLNPFIIVYNNDELFTNKYNYGYDNVFIPLLTQLKNQASQNQYKSELFDFNVFPSIKGKIILCDDNDVTCSFEKSKSYQLFKDIYVESTFNVKLDKNNHPIIDTVNKIIITKSMIVTPFPDKIYTDLKTVKLVEQIRKIPLGNTIQLKEVDIKDLGSFDFSKKENDKKVCKAYPSDPNSKIIKYLPDCQDYLIYCILLTVDKQDDLGKFETKKAFINNLGKYTANFKDFDNTQWCSKK